MRRPFEIVVTTSAVCPLPAKDVTVNPKIHSQDEQPQYELDVSSECRGVKDGKNVVLDESARVARASCLSAERILQRRERADAARELDGGSPDCRRDVKPSHPRPTEDQQSTEHHEQHEQKVEDDDEVSEHRR